MTENLSAETQTKTSLKKRAKTLNEIRSTIDDKFNPRMLDTARYSSIVAVLLIFLAIIFPNVPPFSFEQGEFNLLLVAIITAISALIRYFRSPLPTKASIHVNNLLEKYQDQGGDIDSLRSELTGNEHVAFTTILIWAKKEAESVKKSIAQIDTPLKEMPVLANTNPESNMNLDQKDEQEQPK